MNVKAVIFDMDGLLIDSEPLWQEAGKETLQQFGKTLTTEQYHSSTGLRTEEWIEHWFHHFNIDMQYAPAAAETIIKKAIELIDAEGEPMEGAEHAINRCKEQNLLLGLATSSPLSLVKVVLEKLNLQNSFDAIASAEFLPLGKPHPQVYIDCADALQVSPVTCLALEDSFNGMIAAKAARMKCVVIPTADDYNHSKWNAADAKLRSLNILDFQNLIML
ncbi:MAG: hexitol phosphatase HxpB [Chitinophagaceae bacterium]|nr:hexitol phosphatase HxpB [Chitinophagaceae bacterium]